VGGEMRRPENLMGDQLRDSLLKPELGNWNMSSWMMGECVPLEKIMFVCTMT
jgi:hypothetical protein